MPNMLESNKSNRKGTQHLSQLPSSIENEDLRRLSRLRRSGSLYLGKYRLPYLFLFPAVAILLAFLISPIIAGILLSLQKTRLDGTTSWTGLLNYLRLFWEARFATNLQNSVVYVVGNIALSTPLAYAAAILITSKLPQVRFFRGVFLLPWIIAPVVSTVLFRSLVDPNMGPIALLLERLTGEQVVVLANAKWAMFMIIFHSFWRSFPFIMLFLAAGIATIPDEVYDAAKVDGAGSWKRFTNVTFPLTRSELGISLLTVTMWTLHDAESIYAFTQGGPGYATETLAIRLFKLSFINFDLNTGATIGVILIMISIVFMFFYLRLLRGVKEL
ncbi:MAG: sugar ABC transporter permease [Firmicutes bacterium]|nr:sugar ABC transporter permease [Bacillota bacterium]